MTTTNGGRIVEHAEGVVASSNERGVKLVGEDGYRNFSKYAESPISAPARGLSVRLGLDGSGFVRSVETLSTNISGSPSASSSDRDRAIARMSALRSAAIFCGHRATVHEDVKSSDVLKIAEVWLEWLEQKGEDSAL